MSLLPAVWVYFFFLSHLLSPFSSSSSVYPLLYFSLSQSSLLNSVQPPILLHSSLFDSFPGGDGCIGNWSSSYFPLFCKQYIFLLTVTLQTIELTVATLSLSLSLLFLCFLFFFPHFILYFLSCTSRRCCWSFTVYPLCSHGSGSVPCLCRSSPFSNTAFLLEPFCLSSSSDSFFHVLRFHVPSYAPFHFTPIILSAF